MCTTRFARFIQIFALAAACRVGTAGDLCVAPQGNEAWSVTVHCINESPKEIPVACDADVVIVGGSSGAVAAACEAARQGSRVFLLAPRPYLGTDICCRRRGQAGRAYPQHRYQGSAEDADRRRRPG